MEPSVQRPGDGAPQAVSASLSHYELRQCLGEGGFGLVFEAWDSKLLRGVAIKRLKKEVLPAQGEHGLIREAQLAASLRHPAFVKIHAIEDDAHSHAIVMELVPGQTIRQLLQQHPLGEGLAIGIVRQVAQAMQEAHAAGLVHGDLKPSNLMLEPDGTVRILDFGLAAQADPQATTSMRELDPQGTIAYMAPERLVGAALSPASDIYALGVILYELLSGARPHANLSGLALAAAQMQSSSGQWDYQGVASPALIQLVRAMTERDLKQRLASMQQVDAYLAQPAPALAGAPMLAVNRPRRWSAWRRPAVIALLAATLAGAAVWQLRLPLPLLPQAVSARPNSIAQEMQQGYEALTQFDRPEKLDAAIAHFNLILAHERHNAAAVAGLSLAYSYRYSSADEDETWLQKAAASAQQALALNDQLALGHVAAGRVQTMRHEDAAALKSFERALALEPTNSLATLGKMMVLRLLQRRGEAIQLAEQCLQRTPDERLCADSLGSAYYEQGDHAAAERAFRYSIKVQPDAVYSYANLSAVLQRENRQEEALQVLQQGLQVRSSAVLYGNLGTALFVRGDYVAAAAAFEHAVAPSGGDPSHYLAWANLADTLLWIPGREAEARKAYQRALELGEPKLARAAGDSTLVSRIGLYSARTGDRIRALALMARALGQAPGNANVQFRAALAYELLDMRTEALAAIAKARTLGYPVKLIEAEPDLLKLRRDSRYSRN
ncbi:protein kinase [Oxalobacteraceae bacterium]|nr:protein kinase [Oxalobacteraceae bacterium]